MLSYQVLGQVSVARSGVAVRIGGAQQRRLLGAMLAEPTAVHSVDRLIEVMWPSGAAPAGAERSILTYVSRLRAALGPGSILRVGAGYRLELGQDTVDAHRFLALVQHAEAEVPDRALPLLEEAFELWHGPAFGDLAADWWAVGPARALEQRRLDARELRARCLLALDRPGAVEELEGLVRAMPLQERPVRLLMQSLSGVGRRPDALAAYRRFRESVREETGIDPTSELDELARSIAAGDSLTAPEGLRLRGYRLHELIGEGRQGRLYAATQPGTQRPVAIKVVRSDIAAADGFADRFEMAGQLLGRLEHPHVLPLDDHWREPGQAFLVFRHLQSGGTARQRLRAAGPWPPADVNRLVEQIGPALAAAHAAGIAHHEVQLDTIMLDPEGNAYLTDFGIAVDDARAAASADVRALASATRELLVTGNPAAALLDLVADGAADLLMPEFLARWRAALDSPTEPRSRTEDNAPNPYRGLQPFEAADRAYFHGRTDEVTRLVEQVGAGRQFVTVVGPSGVGKSSLVRAGLIPVLRSSSRPVTTMSPGGSPAKALHEAVRAVTALAPADPPDTGTLASAPERLVLVIDQLEECFTPPGSLDRGFLSALAAALDTRPDLSIVATLRADFLDEALRDPVIGARCAAGLFPVATLGAGQLAEAIAAPAREVGVPVEEALVAVLVAETLAQPGSLPLLQFTLAELFERRGAGGLTLTDLEAFGGVAGSVAGRAEDTYSTLSDSGRGAARALFSRLVAPGDRGGETRHRVLWSELPEGAQAISGPFVDARLLVVDHDPATREPTLELAHDALIRGWPRLAGWVDHDRDWLLQSRDLAAAARRWDGGGRSPADLYRGARLALAAEGLAAGRAATPVEADFVATSEEEAHRELADARRLATRQRRLLIALSMVLVVAVVAASLAVTRQRRAARSEAAAQVATRAARIEALVGRSNALRVTQRDVAALLAVAAWRLADTPTTRSALLATFTDSTGFLDAHHLAAGQLTMGVVMPDGQHAWVGDQQGRLHAYDLETGASGAALASAEPVTGTHQDLMPSPDGRRMLVSQNAYADDGSPFTLVRVVDLTTGQAAFPIRRLPLDLVQTAWSTDGRRAFVMSVDGSGMVLDTATGRRVADLAVPPTRPGTEGEITGGIALVGDRLLVGAPGALVVRDPRSLAVRRTIPVPAGTTLHIYVVGDGTVLGVGNGGLVRVDIGTGRRVWSVDNAGLQCNSAAVMSRFGEIVCGDVVGRLELRSLATGLLVRTLDAQNGNAGSLWPAHEGTELVSFGANEPVVSRWRLDGSGPITRVIAAGSAYPVFTADPSRLAVSAVPRGQVDVARDDREFRVVRTRDGRTVENLAGLVSPGWSSEGTFYAARRLSDGRYDVVRRPRGTSHLVRVAGPFAYHPGVHVQPWLPGATLQTYPGRVGGSVRARAVIDGRVIGTGVTSATATGLDASPDGSRIVVEDAGIHVYDSRTGKELRSVEGGGWVGASMSPDGQMVTTSYSGEMQLWDLATLRALRTFGGGRGYISHVEFSRDGSLVMAPGSDRRVSLFDESTGVRLGTPIEMADDEVSAASLAPDGRALAYGGGWARPVKVMDLRPAAWAASACRLAGRELTREEWQTNVASLAAYRDLCAGPTDQ